MTEAAKGAAQTFGVTEADPWMKGYIARGEGAPHRAPVWLLPSDQQAWLQGWRDAEQAHRRAVSGQ